MLAQMKRHLRGQSRILLEIAVAMLAVAAANTLLEFLSIEKNLWHMLPAMFLGWLCMTTTLIPTVGIVASIQQGSFPAICFGCSRRASFLGDQVNKLLLSVCGGLTISLCGWLQDILLKQSHAVTFSPLLLVLLFFGLSSVTELFARVLQRISRQAAGFIIGIACGMAGLVVGVFLANKKDDILILQFPEFVQQYAGKIAAVAVVAAIVATCGSWLFWRRYSVKQ